LVAGLCPDLLGELKWPPPTIPISHGRRKRWELMEGKREGRGRGRKRRERELCTHRSFQKLALM